MFKFCLLYLSVALVLLKCLHGAWTETLEHPEMQNFFQSTSFLTTFDKTQKREIIRRNVHLDLVFIVDTTKSHKENLKKNVQQNIHQFLEYLVMLYPKIRVGLVTFRDKNLFPFGRSNDYCYKEHSSLTHDINFVTLRFKEFIADGGADPAENPLEAILGCFDSHSNLQWHKEKKIDGVPVLKMMLVITDNMYKASPFWQDAYKAKKVYRKPGRPSMGAPEECLNNEYPEMKTVRDVLKRENVFPVFAVPKEFISKYEFLVNQLKTGAVVEADILDADFLDKTSQGVMENVESISESELHLEEIDASSLIPSKKPDSIDPSVSSNLDEAKEKTPDSSLIKPASDIIGSVEEFDEDKFHSSTKPPKSELIDDANNSIENDKESPQKENDGSKDEENVELKDEENDGSKDEGKEGLKDEGKEGLKDEGKEGLKDEGKEGLKDEGKEGLKDEGKEGLKDEEKKGLKDEGKEGLKDEGKEGLKDEGKEGLKDEGEEGLKDEGKEGLKDEGEEGLKDEGKEGLKDERKNELKEETPSKKEKSKKKKKMLGIGLGIAAGIAGAAAIGAGLAAAGKNRPNKNPPQLPPESPSAGVPTTEPETPHGTIQKPPISDGDSDASTTVPSNLPGSIPSNLPGSMPSNLPGLVPSNLPGSMPSDISTTTSVPGVLPPNILPNVPIDGREPIGGMLGGASESTFIPPGRGGSNTVLYAGVGGVLFIVAGLAAYTFYTKNKQPKCGDTFEAHFNDEEYANLLDKNAEVSILTSPSAFQ